MKQTNDNIKNCVIIKIEFIGVDLLFKNPRRK